MVIPTWLVLLLGVASYFVLPIVIWCNNKEKLKNILTIILFCLYLGVLFCGVFGSLGISERNIVVDFNFSGQWCSKSINWSLASIGTFDLVINLVMLLPVGMVVFYFARKKKWWLRLLFLVAFGALSGLLIETCQFILPIARSVQLSDVLLNVVSVFIGGVIAWLYLFIISKIKERKNL